MLQEFSSLSVWLLLFLRGEVMESGITRGDKSIMNKSGIILGTTLS